MATETRIPVTLKSRNYRDLPSTAGTLTRAEYSKPERTQNAVKLFGIGLGLTFFGALIPIAHYLLVPGGFLATCMLAMDRLGQTFRSLGGSGECPKCHQTVTLEKAKWATRYVDSCNHCHDDLEVLVIDTH